MRGVQRKCYAWVFITVCVCVCGASKSEYFIPWCRDKGFYPDYINTWKWCSDIHFFQLYYRCVMSIVSLYLFYNINQITIISPTILPLPDIVSGRTSCPCFFLWLPYIQVLVWKLLILDKVPHQSGLLGPNKLPTSVYTSVYPPT